MSKKKDTKATAQIMNEGCSCGSYLHQAPWKALQAWRKNHVCPNRVNKPKLGFQKEGK